MGHSSTEWVLGGYREGVRGLGGSQGIALREVGGKRLFTRGPQPILYIVTDGAAPMRPCADRALPRHPPEWELCYA